MKQVFKGSRQTGVALIFSLLILITMTIIGISAMSGTNMQERMAGNAYLQAQAFEAASAGVAQSLDFKDNNFPSGSSCNASTSDEWFTDWKETGSVGDATLKQRMYCLPFYTGDPATDPPAGYELFVLNRGIVSVDGKSVAQREVEVRIGRFGDETAPCNSSAMCFPLQPDIPLDPECGDAGSSNFCSCNFGTGKSSTNPFAGFNSNAFRVIGEELGALGHGTAVSLSPNLEKAFECEVTGGSTEEQCDSNGNKGTCSRLGNYVGGMVGNDNFGSPWNDPADAFAFVNELFSMSMSMSGSQSVEYLTGDHTMKGSDSGSGVLVVEGDLEWNGTPNFDGLIIVLGGSFNVSGGGQGGDGAGSVVVLDLEPKPSEVSGSEDSGSEDSDFEASFGGDFSMEFSGGGTADYKFGCKELNEAWDDLADAQALWKPDCDESGGKPVDATDGIVSWRENIGWRSEDFAGSAP